MVYSAPRAGGLPSSASLRPARGAHNRGAGRRVVPAGPGPGAQRDGTGTDGRGGCDPDNDPDPIVGGGSPRA